MAADIRNPAYPLPQPDQTAETNRARITAGFATIIPCNSDKCTMDISLFTYLTDLANYKVQQNFQNNFCFSDTCAHN